jgi:TolB protein
VGAARPAEIIIFSSLRDQPGESDNSDLYMLDIAYSTAQAFNITRSADDDVGAVWSPDGNQMAFNTFDNDRWEIVGIDFTGRELWRYNDFTVPTFVSDWSPDGSTLLLRSHPSPGVANIVLLDLSTFTRTYLIQDGTRNFSPRFSPDGSQIAVISNRDGGVRLYVMRADGTDMRGVTDSLLNIAGEIDWSPEGSQIAFSSYVNGREQIFTIEVATGETTQISDTPYTVNTHPVWSPDGARIAFMGAAGGGTITADLLIINADGTNLRFISSDAKFPAWRPH